MIFLSLLAKLCSTMKPPHAIAGFSGAGLYPVNKSKVNQLKPYKTLSCLSSVQNRVLTQKRLSITRKLVENAFRQSRWSVNCRKCPDETEKRTAGPWHDESLALNEPSLEDESNDMDRHQRIHGWTRSQDVRLLRSETQGRLKDQKVHRASNRIIRRYWYFCERFEETPRIFRHSCFHPNLMCQTLKIKT